MKVHHLLIAATMASCLVLSASSQAVTIGWWRMGDSDGSLGSAPVNDGDPATEGTRSAVGDDATVRMNPDPVGGVQYSTDVPAPQIYDPIANATLPNAWSIAADAAVRERMLTAGTLLVPTSFSYETFVKFDTSAASVDFALQSRSISGGWRLGTQADGSLRALFQGAVAAGTGPQYTLAAPASTALQPGQWYHVGLIFEGNSADGSDDAHLYVNHQLVASGNVTDSMTFGGAEPAFNFFLGATLSARQVQLDESRYFDTALALDGSDFQLPAGVPLPQLVVDRETGAITLKNNAIGQGDFNILGYTITSPFGALDRAGWKSIANNYDEGNPGAIDGDGEWTILSASDSYEDLSEFTFEGNGATIAAGQSVVLSQGGGAWIPTLVEDLAVEFALADGTFLTLPVTYEGNDGEALVRSDFDGDGSITAADYTNHLMANFPTPTADGASPALRYLQGDLNGDGSINSHDFALFRSDFEAANGGGSFIAMVQGLRQVPEPSTLALLFVGGVGAVFARRKVGVRAIAAALVLGMLTFGVASSAEAELLAWWRLGDDDPNPVAGTTITATLENPETNGLFPVDMIPGAAGPFYSNVVAGSTIIDPLNLAGNKEKYLNNWSVATNVATNQERAVAAQPLLMPTSFTYETLVRFPNVTGATSSDFGYHRTNAGGGWLLELNANGTVHALVQSRDSVSNMNAFSVDLSSSAPLTNDRWHHVALVFAGNSQNGTNDTHLYVDGQLVASGNMDDSSVFGGIETSPLVGEVFQTSGVTIDEARYFSSVVEPANFLRVAGLRTTVNTVTGEIRLENESLTEAIELASYDITSPLGRLLTGESDWNSLSDQDLNSMGTGPGESWTEGGASGAFAIGESFLLGGTTLAPGEFVSLGNAYQEGVIDGGLQVIYTNAATGDAAFSAVEFIAPSPLLGDFNADGTVDAADYVLWRNHLNGSESVLNGNGNGSGTVDTGDYTLWKNNYGQSAPAAAALAVAQVPEPASYAMLLMAAVGLIYLTSKRSFSMSPLKVLPHKVLPLWALAMAGFASSSHAVVMLDRHYTMGDFSDGSGFEGSSANNGPAGAIVGSSFGPPADVLDSAGPQFADLAQSGGPTYVSLSTGAYTRANRGAGNDYAIAFDGVNDMLTGPALNALSETFTQGMQMWVYADSAKLGSGRQTIVSDSFNAGGPAITASGHWTQNFSNHPNDTDIEASVAVVGNTWHHVAQHAWFNSDTAAPDVVPGTGTAALYTSVLYVNGVAVSASNDASIIPTVTTFQVGGAGDTPANFFQGAIDELELYTSAPNDFNLFADNDWIAARIAQIPGGVLKEGDINFDGAVNDGDITAFVAGWRSEKRFNGAHAHVYVGDWQTLGWGDLNLDGRVNLRDALRLHAALAANGAGGLDFALLDGASVPEPSTVALMGVLAIAGTWAIKRRRA